MEGKVKMRGGCGEHTIRPVPCLGAAAQNFRVWGRRKDKWVSCVRLHSRYSGLYQQKGDKSCVFLSGGGRRDTIDLCRGVDGSSTREVPVCISDGVLLLLLHARAIEALSTLL